MTNKNIIFYIFDDLNRFQESFTLKSNSSGALDKNEFGKFNNCECQKKFDSVFKVNGYFLSVFVRTLQFSEIYSKMVFRNILNTLNYISIDSDISIKFQLVKPKLEVLDYSWNEKICNLIIERQELEHAMSWLSTLGGAFSALGDSFENYAKVAGKISVQQFKIAFQLGEPLLVARCRLYMALSLIQLGKLSIAKHMIEKQYAVGQNFKDIRLQNMCKGVWAKLQYIYKQKKINSKKIIS